MAISNNRFVIKFGGDTKELKGAVAEANDSLSGFVDKVKGFGGALIAGFAVGEIAAGLREVMAMAGEAIDGEFRLLQALKGRQDIQARLLDQATLLAQTTLYEDDEIIKQQQILASMGLQEGQIKSVMAAAVELASVYNIDLGQATEALGKSLFGVGKQLGAISPEFKALTEEQLRNGDAIDLVTEKYKGFAEGLTEIGTGPWKEFKENIGEFFEDLGKEILPAINDELSKFNKLSRESGGFWGAIGEYLKVIPMTAPIASLFSGDNQGAESTWDDPIKREANKLPRIKAEGRGKAAPAIPGFEAQPLTVDTAEILKSLQDIDAAQVQAVADAMQNFANTDFSQFNEEAEKLEGTKMVFIDFAAGVEDSMERTAFAMAQGIGDMLSGVAGLGDVGAVLLDSIGKMAQQLGQVAIQTGISMAAIKLAFKNPATAIAAGVALVAIGRAVSNKAQAILKGGSGGGSISAGGFSGGGFGERGIARQTVDVNVRGVVQGRDLAWVAAQNGYNNYYMKGGG